MQHNNNNNNLFRGLFGFRQRQRQQQVRRRQQQRDNNDNEVLVPREAAPPPPVVPVVAAVAVALPGSVQGNNSNGGDDDDNLPIAVELPRHFNHAMLRHHRRGGRRNRWVRATVLTEDVASNVLWSLLQEGVHCQDDLLVSHGGCQQIVEHCRDHPQEVNFICRHSGRTPLHEAALRCCCIHVVRALIQAEHEVFLFDRMSNTPLHLLFTGIACRKLSPERVHPIVDELLQTSPSTMACATNLEGYTPLHVAVTGSEAMVPPCTIVRLLEASATCASKQSRRGEFPLHLHCQRRHASVHVARLLIDAHPAALRAIDGVDHQGFTPLHYACAKLNTELIHVLIQADDFPLRQRSFHGETPLHVFCRQKPTTDEHLQVLQRMLSLVPEAATWRDSRRGATPLHSLCQSSTLPPAIFNVVLAEAPKEAVQVSDSQQLLPLHTACETGVVAKVVDLLLQADPKTARAVTRKKDTPLHLACSANQSVDTIQLLLQHYPEATMLANNYGYLPLHGSVRSYQPHRAIVAALMQVSPQSLTVTTNGGESAIHLLSNNTSASTTLLNDMNRSLKQVRPASLLPSPVLSTKIGNSPLHFACFRGAQKEHIESLAISNPEWLAAPNSAGFTPLQILCKSGRVDAELITLFARLGGPDIFSATHRDGNTPLHSAIRSETDLQALQALIRACPRVLHAKTIYEDTPLHLACLRRVSADVVHEVALASCQGLEVSLANCDQRISPILLENTAGQTPISIAMDEYLKAFSDTPQHCAVKLELTANKKRAFDVLASLVRMLHYGPATVEEAEKQNLVLACVSLHRKNVRLDPGFLRRAILAAPEQVAQCDELGNYPLHLEACIPIEKMFLLDGARQGCCGGTCSRRAGVLRLLLDIYPRAARQRNNHGDFPLALMIRNGRQWDSTFSLILRTHPQAFHWVGGVQQAYVPRILSRVARECGKETVLSLLTTRPDIILVDPTEPPARELGKTAKSESISNTQEEESLPGASSSSQKCVLG